MYLQHIALGNISFHYRYSWGPDTLHWTDMQHHVGEPSAWSAHSVQASCSPQSGIPASRQCRSLFNHISNYWTSTPVSSPPFPLPPPSSPPPPPVPFSSHFSPCLPPSQTCPIKHHTLLVSLPTSIVVRLSQSQYSSTPLFLFFQRSIRLLDLPLPRNRWGFPMMWVHRNSESERVIIFFLFYD